MPDTARILSAWDDFAAAWKSVCSVQLYGWADYLSFFLPTRYKSLSVTSHDALKEGESCEEIVFPSSRQFLFHWCLIAGNTLHVARPPLLVVCALRTS